MQFQPILLATIACLAANLTFAEPASIENPNVILIYADDLGAGMLGCYGQKIIKTPHIDRLAAEGMRFTNAHGCMYCAPARASLLTGLHDAHKGAWSISRGGLIVRKPDVKQADLNDSKHMPAKENEVFLAQLAQRAGYKTAQFGKLDWGFLTNHYRLTRHGWDHYLGYYDHQRAHGFYPPYLWHNGEKLQLPGNTHANAGKTKESYGPGSTERRRNRDGKVTYSQNVFIKHMLKYVDDNKDQRFFMYHSTQIPHGPVDIPEVHPDFVNDKRLNDIEKEYASMVKMLDDHVGLLMAKLMAHGLDDKTVVMFTADNGHETYYLHGGKGPTRKREYHGNQKLDVFHGSMALAGAKWTNWQGGIRVPLIVRWPGKIRQGSESNRLTAAYDYMPTIASLTGAKMPMGKDGIDMSPTLLGKQEPERAFIMVNDAVISKDWKLVKDKGTTYLFNLKEDPGERTNLASKFPEKLARLQTIYNREKNSARRDL